MSYIICAKAYLDEEPNHLARRELVDARTLSVGDDEITFDVKADFDNRPALVAKLCKSMIDAGFLSFKITHSY